VLSQESLRRFYKAHQAPNTTCYKDGRSEDVEIARCLRTKGVYPDQSLDKYNHERFHPLKFIDHFNSKPDWLKKYAENPTQTVSLSKNCFVNYLLYCLFSTMIVVVINRSHSIMLVLENNI
jgi:hypothetical protein